jgi:hypothetical protein
MRRGDVSILKFVNCLSHFADSQVCCYQITGARVASLVSTGLPWVPSDLFMILELNLASLRRGYDGLLWTFCQQS